MAAAPATPQSDIFPLSITTHQTLTGHLPYGADAAKPRTTARAS